MPAKSQAQQRFMGIVHAIQKGDAKASDFSKDAQDTAKEMKPSDAKDFASTKHKGLPNHVKKENMEKELKEIIRQTYRESLRESVNEAKAPYEVYHKSYTSAIEAAREYAEKKGFEIDNDDAFRKIGVGPRKPSEGKTNSFSIQLSKDGKLQRKQLHIQVYGMKNSYELNAYIG